MLKRWPAVGLLALVATLATTVSSTSAGVAEPTEPTVEWVQTTDDSVMAADTWRAMTEQGIQFQPISTSGPGFNLFYYRNYGEYTIRLATSPHGDIEAYRALAQQTANEINAQTGMLIQVAPGTVAAPADPYALQAPVGEIWVMISDTSPCGSLSGGVLGCGGIDAGVFIDGEARTASGVVWLRPNLANQCRQQVTNHEIGHALGLAHFGDLYLGQKQVMAPSTNCTFSAFQAGDINGLNYLVTPTPSNDSIGAADDVCPYRDTTMSASTWFATKEAGEPAHAGAGPRRSVWYRFVPLSTGTTKITTTNDSNGDFDTVLSVYSGAMFGGAVAVASNDDFAGTLSEVTFNAIAGTTYWIAVDGKGLARGETDVVFDLAAPAPVPTIEVGVPIRLMDTRRPGGQTIDCYSQAVGRLAAGSTYQLQVTGRSWVPASGVTSAVLNVTVVSPAEAGYLTVYPCGQTRPNASNLNFAAGDVIPNLVVAAIGSGGKVCIFTSVETNLLVDTSGHFSGSAPMQPLSAPGRLLDTRAGGQTVDGLHSAVGRIAANVPYELPVGSRAGLVASPSTVVLNVTAVNPSGGGYVSVYPCGLPAPNASNLNFAAGDVIPNLVVAKVGAGSKVCFISSVETDLLVDVAGEFKGANWMPLNAPGRLLDTRNPGSPTVDGLHQGLGRIGAGATYELAVTGRANVLAGADSVVLNVTAVNPSGGGYLTVYPCGSPQPNASNLNFSAGDVIPNSVMAKVGTGGKVCIFTSAETDVLVDVSGFFDY